ncbi:MAG: hypothetical protein A2782_02060 [Candidatus Blackburnbacteria bacterium RIFCSPHIGHO2_01_FULL_43_15b]|uniref:Uncharacterized protein n=1 Tax=Candidatus Blackburnbacteria bacterium RIFCSPHIGHO2_01_FULL_43_15b TaxID=1797513 RepID=A0A1G1UY60_9BACT|nr:MAG: hypothetical protein A2782_02060 [Candidatus Blackburnbacteria bacterium RIFCSPHIGHO2_01_FULL_43_15b]
MKNQTWYYLTSLFVRCLQPNLFVSMANLQLEQMGSEMKIEKLEEKEQEEKQKIFLQTTQKIF